MHSASLWVITTYFNPTANLWRLRNLQAFRHHLSAPLLVVELAQPGENQLSASAADKVVTLTGDPQIWQKERLLNLAVQHLPAETTYVAWVDSDIVFERPGWQDESMAQLRSGKQLVQPFDTVARLPRLDPNTLDDIDALRAIQPVEEKPSFTYGLHGGYYSTEQAASARVDTGNGREINRAYGYTHGVGWVARRDLLQEVGLYDACVIGGGPSAMALAGIGQPEKLFEKRPMSDAHRRHYLAWAGVFHYNTEVDVAFVPGRALHLWHGPYESRRYHDRHVELKNLGFDPDVHLERAENGTWCWSPRAKAMQHAVKGYFSSRAQN